MSETRIRRLPHYLYRFFVYGIGGLVTTFMILPIFLTLLMSVTSGQTLRFPPEGLSLHWYADLLNPVISHTEQVATFNSLKIAVLAVLGSFCLTVPAAIGMTHLRGRTAVFLEPVLLAPLVLPSRNPAVIRANGHRSHRYFFSADVSSNFCYRPGYGSLARARVHHARRVCVYHATASPLANPATRHRSRRLSRLY